MEAFKDTLPILCNGFKNRLFDHFGMTNHLHIKATTVRNGLSLWTSLRYICIADWRLFQLLFDICTLIRICIFMSIIIMLCHSKNRGNVIVIWHNEFFVLSFSQASCLSLFVFHQLLNLMRYQLFLRQV